MSVKAWASLAPLLDQRRYVESIVAGIKVHAHPDFRFATTMNDDASTYDLPEYIASRILPRIVVDYPDAEEELRILAANLPFAPPELLRYVVAFLQTAHEADERYSVRDGINIARYALKRLVESGVRMNLEVRRERIAQYMKEAGGMILDANAARYFREMIDGQEAERDD